MSTAYISGHHPSVLRSHTWRTATNSAPHLLPLLKSHADYILLDVGCGPGTITLDFAATLSRGHVYGLDPSAEVIEQARKAAEERGVSNVTFLVGDVMELGDAFDGFEVVGTEGVRFDVVHCHQVLQHLGQPLEAFKAMKAVLKPTGVLSCRETLTSTWAWWPEDPKLYEFRKLWGDVAKSLGCDPMAGARLVSYAMAAGFKREQIQATTSAWCYSTPEEREWWGSLWAERMFKSDFHGNAKKAGLATDAELEGYAEAWKKWAAAEDGWFTMVHGEVLCFMSPDHSTE